MVNLLLMFQLVYLLLIQQHFYIIYQNIMHHQVINSII